MAADKGVTVYDVAKDADVSIATVSFTIHHPEKVREKTRQRVERSIKTLGYVPSASARGLAKGKTGALGLYSFDFIIERAEGSESTAAQQDEVQDREDCELDERAYPLYVDEIQRGFELESWHQGKTLLLGSSTMSGEESVTSIAGRVDGLALFPRDFNDSMMLRRLSKRMPIVVYSRGLQSQPVASIMSDNASGMRLIIDHLVNAHGLRRLAFVGRLDSDDLTTRFHEYLAYQQKIGLIGAEEQGRLIEATPNEMDAFVSSVTTEALPDAFVCGTDQLALSVLSKLRGLGIRVPDDVAVTGFDGILAGRLASPQLTTVRQSMEEMGRLGVKLLLRNDGRPLQSPELHILPVKLMLRQSCGCGLNGGERSLTVA
ncbi:MAG: LacI family DNA-binding transcriptional regulator [Bifidobacterium sp.]|uniref:LacI family DNA-binding transcriptional regulator n=1 Tax=Bifidobacterium sp. TaxID=41200 RepID=UPI0039E8F590